MLCHAALNFHHTQLFWVIDLTTIAVFACNPSSVCCHLSKGLLYTVASRLYWSRSVVHCGIPPVLVKVSQQLRLWLSGSLACTALPLLNVLPACSFAGPFCTACAPGDICPGGGRLSPVVCPANSFAPPGAIAVQQCVCKAGYGRPENSSLACTTCPICEGCPVGSYSGGASTGSCIPCGRGRTTAAVHSSSPAACVCAPG